MICDTYMHFILDGRLIAARRGNGTPRVGDEIRNGEGEFYRVLRVVWVYDERDSGGQRVNIELEKAP